MIVISLPFTPDICPLMTYKELIATGVVCLALGQPMDAQSVSVAPDTVDADASTLAWMAQHGSAISAFDRVPDEGDLTLWDALTANARIIGLGEQTHGSSEFTRTKLRLIAHGVRSQHVTVIGFENVPAPVAAINRYLHGDSANVDSLMGHLSKLWRTEEVKSVVLWLHDYNVEQRRMGAPQVDMVGVDIINSSPARDSGMAESMAAEIARRSPESRAMMWAHNIHVSYLPNRIGVQLRRLIGARYVALGFATAEGTYRARTPTDATAPLSEGHVLPPPTPGSAELSLSRLSGRVGGVAQLYDLRGIIADPRGAWLRTPRNFHHVGTSADALAVQVQNVGEMFDLLMFVPRTTTSHSIPGIQM
jgi:erythromycin esterase-like protein